MRNVYGFGKGEKDYDMGWDNNVGFQYVLICYYSGGVLVWVQYIVVLPKYDIIYREVIFPIHRRVSGYAVK